VEVINAVTGQAVFIQELPNYLASMALFKVSVFVYVPMPPNGNRKQQPAKEPRPRLD
jgi:hypothetical protein